MESTGDDEEMDSEGESDGEIIIMIVGSYGEDREHQDDGRCERGMERSGDYRCKCKWEVTRTVIVQGVDGLRAVEGTERICFGCAEDRCRRNSCELRIDEKEYEDEDETARPEFGTYSLKNENEMVDMASRNETTASPAVLRVQKENLGGRRTDAQVDFEEPRTGGPGYRSLDEESVCQGTETSRTDRESLDKRGEIDAYLKSMGTDGNGDVMRGAQRQRDS